MTDFTTEQLEAIERRQGELLLDASAGAGKTSVLVERFVRAVTEDGVEVPAMLAITFTDKAAAELRERIRQRLRKLGADEAARATEGAYISTIHGFCARVLRVNALAAGIDPAFEVLDEAQSSRLADEAFDAALEDLAQTTEGAIELIASYGAFALRAAIQRTYAALRSRGQTVPTLEPLPVPPDLSDLRAAAERAARAAAAELGAIAAPSVKVIEALARLERLELLAAPEPWPGDLDRLALPGGNGAALTTPLCVEYGEALQRFRAASAARLASGALAMLERLLKLFGERYLERKRARSGLDFADLELMTRDLLAADPALRERYRARFEQIMVDELQDTNSVQLELIESVARGNLFTVGDALQSIYGFRHADVSLFEARRARGEHATLTTNFRSRREILEPLNAAFGAVLGERFTPLVPGRVCDPVPDPRVELLLAEKGADWGEEGLAAPWRIAEARALAGRLRELIDLGAAPGEIVLLMRATTDMRVFERALEDRAIPTYVIGGRGYWSHPQVVDIVAYLRALANPRDEEALFGVLASPLVGVSDDALVLLAAAARAAGRDPWWLLRDSAAAELDDRARLDAFVSWFAAERRASAHLGVEELIERVLELTDYDLAVLAMPGGERRLANVRKLMRLGREFDGGLSGFVELVRSGRVLDARESEAPVEGEALDAVRLMTIHRAKGLEFPIVCVADLGRVPRWGGELLRVGRDGRIGLRLARPGTGKREPALDYVALGDEARAAEAEEERRLFYVAMTRAQERLILSGALRLESERPGSEPMAWIAPAFGVDGSGGAVDGVSWKVVLPGDVDDRVHRVGGLDRPGPGSGGPEVPAPPPIPPAAPAPPVTQLSYSSLGEYARCGYRFYLERVLGLPRTRERGAGGPGAPGLSGAERGVIAHALLERLDFRRPAQPSAEAVAACAAASGLAPSPAETAELRDLVERFAASALCGRLARATDVRREERFAFALGSDGVPITGILDVVAREGDRLLVVDYKSDRLDGADPASLLEREYALQRLVYALAGLAAGAEQVEVVHVFLELPEQPLSATFTSGERAALERRLAAATHGVLAWDFGVSEVPSRAVCASCPGEGGLCSWPLEMTRRGAADRLF